MEITVFDLILIIKDTEKPFVLFHKKDNSITRYSYAEVASDNETLSLPVAGVRVETIDGKPSYLIKVRG